MKITHSDPPSEETTGKMFKTLGPDEMTIIPTGQTTGGITGVTTGTEEIPDH